MNEDKEQKTQSSTEIYRLYQSLIGKFYRPNVSVTSQESETDLIYGCCLTLSFSEAAPTIDNFSCESGIRKQANNIAKISQTTNQPSDQKEYLHDICCLDILSDSSLSCFPQA
jgi:hypothetical protein